MKRILIVLVLLAPLATFAQTPKSIKNTQDFINYLQTAGTIKSYIEIKKSIEKSVGEVKKNAILTEDQKIILQEKYGTFQAQTETLYKKIVEDLISKEKRKEIREKPQAYAKNLDAQLKLIKEASDGFDSKYQEFAGKKSIFIQWLIKEILFPIVKSFVNELIDNKVKSTLDKYLMPIIVAKPWDQIK